MIEVQFPNGSPAPGEDTSKPNPDYVSVKDASRYNRSAIRKHALKVSKETRNGKFERVSQEFIDSVIAECESKLLLMRNTMVNSAFRVVDCDVNFLTGEGKRRLCEAFEVWIAREVQRKVNNVRIGKTL